ncbi:MAG: flavodoxin family protein [Tannerellaceae bacterium]|jgi:multimeric flavodoxin WrbA|nr:flavodoxin family protein [Tannerellaceae bacterium]
MKVLLVNGSPHAKGCTFTALSEIASTLEKQDIETEIFQLGVKSISGCRGCNKCNETNKCIIDDIVNEFVLKAAGADGFIFGSPVHYASSSGAITSFMDRVFYSGGDKLAFKPGSVVVSCRRAGSTAALDQLLKYLTINNMPVISSDYWNMVHGFTPDDVRKDIEGLHTMRTLGYNMAWLLRCIEAGKKAGFALPEKEEKQWTNFIR